MWWGKSSDNADPKASAPSAKETAAAAPSSASSAAASAPVDPRYDSSTPRASTDASTPSDPKKLPDRAKLPPALQRIVDKQDKEDSFWDFNELVDG